MTDRDPAGPYPDWPPDQDVDLNAENPEGQMTLPGFPAGFLAYQITYRCRKGCLHRSDGASVDGGGRGQAERAQRERSELRSPHG